MTWTTQQFGGWISREPDAVRAYYADMESKLATLRAQRDELVQALEQTCASATWHIDTRTGTPDLDGSKLRTALDAARAALAKVRK